MRGSRQKASLWKTVERSTFWATFARGNDLYELIVKIDWLESRMPLFKANCLTRKESSPRAKVRPCSSASPNPGCELFCSTCTCRRTILCHSGTRCPRLTRRRLGWLGQFDSASPERLITSCREPPRHFLTCRDFQTLARADASGTGSPFYWRGSLVGVENLVRRHSANCLRPSTPVPGRGRNPPSLTKRDGHSCCTCLCKKVQSQQDFSQLVRLPSITP